MFSSWKKEELYRYNWLKQFLFLRKCAFIYTFCIALIHCSNQLHRWWRNRVVTPLSYNSSLHTSLRVSLKHLPHTEAYAPPTPNITIIGKPKLPLLKKNGLPNWSVMKAKDLRWSRYKYLNKYLKNLKTNLVSVSSNAFYFEKSPLW